MAGTYFELTLESELNGQKAYNVFHYRSADPIPPLTEVSSAFVGQMLGELVNIISTSVTYTKLTIVDLLAPQTSFLETSLASTGAVASESLKPNSTWSFKLARTDRTSNSGGKRFMGVPESLQDAGVAVAGASQALDDVAEQLANPLEFASVEIAYPAIITYEGTLSGGYTNFVVNDVQDGIYRKIGSQKGRAYS